MNERIEQLAKQADIKFDKDLNEIDVCVMLPSDLEKFAELIVRECYNIAEEHDCNLSGNGGQILTHFGVE
jgi:hypothetical protein